MEQTAPCGLAPRPQAGTSRQNRHRPRRHRGAGPAPPSPDWAPLVPRPGGRARPRPAPAPGARRPGQGDRGRGPDAHLLSDAHVVLAEQAADALREGVDRAAVAVLLGAASAPRRLRAGGQQPEQQRQQQQQEPGPGLRPTRGACSHPGAGGTRGSGRRGPAVERDAAAPAGTA